MPRQLHFQRRSLRLHGYRYGRPGAYFVTVVTQDRRCLFANSGNVRELTAAGECVGKFWKSMPARFPGIAVDALVVMPNHIHGIVLIQQSPAGGIPVRLGDVVGAFKSLSTRAYSINVMQQGWPAIDGNLWQRNYYEHVIRDDASLDRIREYIVNNPLAWDLDHENPAAGKR